jgi:hypothetical protein
MTTSRRSDLGSASPKSARTGAGYGVRAPSLRSRAGMTTDLGERHPGRKHYNAIRRPSSADQ